MDDESSVHVFYILLRSDQYFFMDLFNFSALNDVYGFAHIGVPWVANNRAPMGLQTYLGLPWDAMGCQQVPTSANGFANVLGFTLGCGPVSNKGWGPYTWGGPVSNKG